ncbi:MAG: hypothetical protein AVDCRST_MAG10-1586, partial [uncultured Acidimicrobiales bacterium]
ARVPGPVPRVAVGTGPRRQPGLVRRRAGLPGDRRHRGGQLRRVGARPSGERRHPVPAAAPVQRRRGVRPDPHRRRPRGPTSGEPGRARRVEAVVREAGGRPLPDRRPGVRLGPVLQGSRPHPARAVPSGEPPV